MLTPVENEACPPRRNVALIFIAGAVFGLLLNWMSTTRKSYQQSITSPDTILLSIASKDNVNSGAVTVELNVSNSSNNSKKKRLGDGCRFVYLDIGSNVGVQVRKLFEGDRYPDAPFVKNFEKRFGSQEDRQSLACAFGIEANSRHEARLKDIEHCYNDVLGWRTKFFVPNLADNVDGKVVKFYVDSLDWANNVASTAFVNSKFKYPRKREINVTSMDLGSFIMNEIVGRDIPDGPGTPFVYMKLDIEGSEFVVLPDLMAKGAFCHVDEAIIEYHHRFMETSENKMLAELVDALMTSFTKLGDKAIGCKQTKFTTQDEETYLRDGKPLPNECPVTEV